MSTAGVYFLFLRSKPTVPADKVILIVVSTSFRKPPVPDVGALGLPPMVISAQEILYQRCYSLGSAQEFFERSPRFVIERAFHHPCGPVSGRGSNRLSLLKNIAAEHGPQSWHARRKNNGELPGSFSGGSCALTNALLLKIPQDSSTHSGCHRPRSRFLGRTMEPSRSAASEVRV